MSVENDIRIFWVVYNQNHVPMQRGTPEDADSRQTVRTGFDENGSNSHHFEALSPFEYGFHETRIPHLASWGYNPNGEADKDGQQVYGFSRNQDGQTIWNSGFTDGDEPGYQWGNQHNYEPPFPFKPEP